MNFKFVATGHLNLICYNKSIPNILLSMVATGHLNLICYNDMNVFIRDGELRLDI